MAGGRDARAGPRAGIPLTRATPRMLPIVVLFDNQPQCVSAHCGCAVANKSQELTWSECAIHPHAGKEREGIEYDRTDRNKSGESEGNQ